MPNHAQSNNFSVFPAPPSPKNGSTLFRFAMASLITSTGTANTIEIAKCLRVTDRSITKVTNVYHPKPKKGDKTVTRPEFFVPTELVVETFKTTSSVLVKIDPSKNPEHAGYHVHFLLHTSSKPPKYSAHPLFIPQTPYCVIDKSTQFPDVGLLYVSVIHRTFDISTSLEKTERQYRLNCLLQTLYPYLIPYTFVTQEDTPHYYVETRAANDTLVLLPPHTLKKYTGPRGNFKNDQQVLVAPALHADDARYYVGTSLSDSSIRLFRCSPRILGFGKIDDVYKVAMKHTAHSTLWNRTAPKYKDFVRTPGFSDPQDLFTRRLYQYMTAAQAHYLAVTKMRGKTKAPRSKPKKVYKELCALCKEHGLSFEALIYLHHKLTFKDSGLTANEHKRKALAHF